MDQEQPYRPTPEVATRLLHELLTESTGTLKLYFTLSTGALVLLTNLLANSHSPRSTLVILALAIFSFGGSSLFCLRLLMGILQMRSLAVNSILSPDESLTEVQRKMNDWSAEMKRPGKAMERLFYAGVVLSALFVAALVIVR